MVTKKTYVQPWRILVAILFTIIAFVLIIYWAIYWFQHDELTRMQMFKALWYVPLIATVLLFSAKALIEKFKKLNRKY